MGGINIQFAPHCNENPASPWQTIKEDGLQQNSQDVGTHLMTELAKLRDKYEIIGDVRGKGLMIGVEMVKDKVHVLLR